MQGRILVTGFEPFGEHLSNISEDIAKLLEGEIVRDCVIESLILSVDESGSRAVSNLLHTNKYEAILHMGLAEKAEFPRIEMRAKDILDFRIPDNSGRQLTSTKISGRGDLKSTIIPL